MNDKIELARMTFAMLTPRERREIFTAFAPPPAPAAPGPDKLVRRAAVAEMLSRSGRAIDRLAADGVLHRVTLPGRKRAAGFRLADVQRLIGTVN